MIKKAILGLCVRKMRLETVSRDYCILEVEKNIFHQKITLITKSYLKSQLKLFRIPQSNTNSLEID